MAKDKTTLQVLFKQVARLTGGAFGAGVVLIVLPAAALFYYMFALAANTTFGLPLMAIFGIMMLLGALSLVSSVFYKFGLTDRTQALALPEGSIRAVIAMALIVLFAIISIMLYQSLSAPYEIPNLNDADRSSIIKDAANRVIAVRPDICAAQIAASGSAPAKDVSSSDASCAATDKRWKLIVRVPPGQETTDLAKQLLILIGTLMTSLTSYYFASRNPANVSINGSPSGNTTPAPSAPRSPAPSSALSSGPSSAPSSALSSGPSSALSSAPSSGPSSGPSLRE